MNFVREKMWQQQPASKRRQATREQPAKPGRTAQGLERRRQAVPERLTHTSVR